MTHKKSICIVLMFAILFVPACGSSSGGQNLTNTTAALTIMALLLSQNPSDILPIFLFTLIAALFGVDVIHTILSVPNQIPDLLYTEITNYGLVSFFFTIAALIQLFGQSQVQGVPPETFPEGQGADGFTVSANMPMLLPEGDYHIVHMSCGANIPIADPDPTRVYQYAFVFDSDGDTGNNYTTANNDFFNDTDRWYVMSYDNVNGWVLTVSTAFNSTVVEVASAARGIIRDNSMTLVVPASEFAVSDPDYRVTAFCHTGDFGIPGPPHNWSGDLHPPVADGLEPFPAQLP